MGSSSSIFLLTWGTAPRGGAAFPRIPSWYSRSNWWSSSKLKTTKIRQLSHEEVHFSRRNFPLYLVCPDWTDPRNVGAAFRLADAAGLGGLILAGNTPGPPHAKIAKTARSTERSVRWQNVTDLVAFLQAEKAQGHLVLALEITDRSQSLFEYKLPEVTAGRRVYLLAGNEARGISQELLDLCEDSLHLPMYGQNTSMNVAVATGAAVYLLLQQLA